MTGHSKLRVFRCLALGLALFPLAVCAQQERGTIVGQLRVASAIGPPTRTLVALESRGAILGSAYSDGQGRFSFTSLPANTYYLIVDAEGFQPVREQVRFDPSVGRTVILTITLTPRPVARSGNEVRLEGGNPHVVDVDDYLSRFSKRVRSDYEKGLKAERRGKFDEAIHHYRRALSAAPEFYPAHNNLGTLLLGQGDFQAAQREFEEVMRLNQNDAAAYFNLGNVFLLTQRYEEARAILELGLSKEPDHAFGHFLLGTIRVRTGKLQEAERSLREAIRLDPTMSKPHLELVNLYLRQEQSGDAINELRVFLEAFPEDPMASQAQQVLTRLQAAQARMPAPK